MKLHAALLLLLAASLLAGCPGPGPTPVHPAPEPASGDCAAAARNYITVLRCDPDATEADFERLCEAAEAGGRSSSIGPACIAQASSCGAADRCQPGQAP